MKAWKLDDLPERVRKQVEDQLRPAVPAPDLEPAVRHAPVATEKGKGLAAPCSVHMHSRRHRLTDSDGASGKAVLDGLVLAGLLADDSPEIVKEVSYSQEKVSSEELEITIVTISPADTDVSDSADTGLTARSGRGSFLKGGK